MSLQNAVRLPRTETAVLLCEALDCDLKEENDDDEGACPRTIALKQLRFTGISDEMASALFDGLLVDTSTPTQQSDAETSHSIKQNNLSMRLCNTIGLLEETKSVVLYEANIDDEDVCALADAVKANTTVTSIDLRLNGIGAEGASALADALLVNTSVTRIQLGFNMIGDAGASALADALCVNSSVTSIELNFSMTSDAGASALVNALKVNTSLTEIDLSFNEIAASHIADVDELIARNVRLRHLFLFDARQMLLSVMCADECGVVWPYLLDGDDLGFIKAPGNVKALRTEFAAVVEERRRCAAAAIEQL
jgi:hypothetical protein